MKHLNLKNEAPKAQKWSTQVSKPVCPLKTQDSPLSSHQIKMLLQHESSTITNIKVTNVVQGFPVQNYSIRTARYWKCISAALAKVWVALPCGRNLSSVYITICDPKFSGWKKLWKSAKTSKKLICGKKSISPGFAPLTAFSLLSNRLTLHFFFFLLPLF